MNVVDNRNTRVYCTELPFCEEVILCPKTCLVLTLPIVANARLARIFFGLIYFFRICSLGEFLVLRSPTKVCAFCAQQHPTPRLRLRRTEYQGRSGQKKQIILLEFLIPSAIDDVIAYFGGAWNCNVWLNLFITVSKFFYRTRRTCSTTCLKNGETVIRTAYGYVRSVKFFIICCSWLDPVGPV
jgi:hypothetical protein